MGAPRVSQRLRATTGVTTARGRLFGRRDRGRRPASVFKRSRVRSGFGSARLAAEQVPTRNDGLSAGAPGRAEIRSGGSADATDAGPVRIPGLQRTIFRGA